MPMVATRLSDAQKEQIVARYRDGHGSTELAAAYGCSANTVTRLVKAALDPQDYERLKQQRQRGLRPAAADEAAASEPAASEPTPSEPAAASEPPAPAPAALEQARDDVLDADDPDGDDDGPGVLAIDDADDFGEDADADADLEDDGDDAGEDDAATFAEFVPVPVHLDGAVEELVRCRALSEARLPDSAYLLVDRTVELQPLALGECPDLGPLPEEEAGRQALVLFLNPRQAKRHCGRSQRVIKLPDVGLLERTAPYLVAQGISRVVIEGGVYSLPGS